VRHEVNEWSADDADLADRRGQCSSLVLLVCDSLGVMKLPRGQLVPVCPKPPAPRSVARRSALSVKVTLR